MERTMKKPKATKKHPPRKEPRRVTPWHKPGQCADPLGCPDVCQEQLALTGQWIRMDRVLVDSIESLESLDDIRAGLNRGINKALIAIEAKPTE
jgi:hypothetical protein